MNASPTEGKWKMAALLVLVAENDTLIRQLVEEALEKVDSKLLPPARVKKR